jgi:hypothetical protein
MSLLHASKRSFYPWIVIVFFLSFLVAHAATGGSIAGRISDANGEVIAGARLTLINVAQHAMYTAATDSKGLYSFPNLPVGEYTLQIEAGGFATQQKTILTVTTDSALRSDTQMIVRGTSDTVTITAGSAVQVESSATHLGEVVSATEMTAIPLNGRSYIDLLAIQPGVAPVSTLLPSSVIMAGVTGSINPSGDLNAGNLSINGQRESANSFLVNGIDVQEHMNGGTSVVPNLDSIEEFRVLTNNFDPEYGNYNGGIVTVVSRGGTNRLHGSGFEFFRNTALDARGFFDPTRSAFNQNQFGGTIGGPVVRGTVFFFSDYQGTRTTQGVSTGNISVPTLDQRMGNFADNRGNNMLAGSTVSGPYLASLLSQRLGYTVGAGEDYADVFPGGVIPQRGWSVPARNLLQYIPSPNVNLNDFSTSASEKTVRDDKGSARVDLNGRHGTFSCYYFLDDYDLDNPYPGAVAGASIPGFNALTIGRNNWYHSSTPSQLGHVWSANSMRASFAMQTSLVNQRAVPELRLHNKDSRQVTTAAPASLFRLRSLRVWRILRFPRLSWGCPSQT